MEATWNQLVDNYINQGQDSRSREEIERCAKIDSANGPLFKACEAVNCGAFENGNQKFDRCGRCKKVNRHFPMSPVNLTITCLRRQSVYCGKNCQRQAWKTHKSVCCAEGQHEPSLPSQEAIRRSCTESFQREAVNIAERNATLSMLRDALDQTSFPRT
jgi:hypothetical protein